MIENSYLWARPFRLRILAACAHRDWYASIGAVVIKPEYFETKEEQALARFIAAFYGDYRRAPTADEIFAQFTPCDDIMDATLCEVADLVVNKPDELEYAKKKAVEFAKAQAMGLALLQGIKLREEGKPEEVEAVIREAMRVGEDVKDLGIDLVKDASVWINPQAENVSERISTGLYHMDMRMGGGHGRGEYGLVIGPPGSGKTRTLVNFGIGAASLISKARVLHITLEMSKRAIARRYGMRITGKAIERGDEIIFEQEFLRHAGIKMRGSIRIKQYPNKRLAIDELNRYLDSLALEGCEPDLIIIDYPTNMRHNPKLEYRHQLADTTEELRGIAVERNLAMWGAAQTNRAALYKEIVDKGDIAECWDQVATADCAFTICQTKAEKAENLLRYYAAKLREEEDNWIVRCKVDPSVHAVESLEVMTLAEMLQLKEEKSEQSFQIIKQ